MQCHFLMNGPDGRSIGGGQSVGGRAVGRRRCDMAVHRKRMTGSISASEWVADENDRRQSAATIRTTRHPTYTGHLHFPMHPHLSCVFYCP